LKILGIVITKNEEIHISRCISSLTKFVDDVLVVDAISDDATIEIAKNYGAKVIKRRWVSYSEQLNWLLENHATEYDYVLRLDADEYINSSKPKKFRETLVKFSDSNFRAISVQRSYKFLGSLLQDSEFNKRNVVRIFTPEHRFTNRLTDEKLIYKDHEHSIIDLEIIDENLKSIESWLIKHVKYSILEAKNFKSKGPMSRVQKIYYFLPKYFRASLYFNYRFFITQRLRGGISAQLFVVCQSLLYRLIVDFQITEDFLSKKTQISKEQFIYGIFQRAIESSKKVDINFKNTGDIRINYNSNRKFISHRSFLYSLSIKIRIFLNLFLLVILSGFYFFGIRSLKKFAFSTLFYFILLDIIVLSNFIQSKKIKLEIDNVR